MTALGVRTWGNGADGTTVMLTGTYQLDGEVSRRLLRALPTLLVLPDDAWENPLVGLLADEIVADDPGRRPYSTACSTSCSSRCCAPGSRAPRPTRRAGTAPTATRSSATRCA